MREMYLNRSIAEAVMQEMENDDKVILIGEDLLNRGGGMSIFLGVPQKFRDRCLEMPIAELGFTHFANGAAQAGHRPIVDLMFSDFATIPMDAIINGAPKVRFCSLGELSCPAVYIMANGGRATYGGGGSGCHHSQCVESWFQNVPGLKIIAPYYPSDVKGLLKAAIRDNDPVVFLYHEGSLGVKGVVSEDDYIISINNAANVIKQGTDVTLVAVQSMVPLAVKAIETLESEGISVELIDPRVLIPLDEEKIINSVKKTGRLVVAHEAPVRGGFGGEIAAVAAENCGHLLKAPIKRVGSLNSPIAAGYAEYYMVPHIEDIVAAVKETLK